MALRADTIREFGELFERDEPPRAQTHRAVVTAVDGGTVYVDVSGNGETTPIETTSAGYAIGDEVQVEQRGGRLHVSGNVTQPSVGAQHVEQAVAPVARTAAQAQSASQSAQRVATEAAEVANAVNQHFFSDTDGVHVTEAEQEDWTANHSGKNILINSLGILLRNALNNLVSITESAIAFFDGNGNAASNVVAQFGASGAQIGKSGESHMELDYHSLQLIDKEGDAYFHVSDLRGADGTAEFTDTWTGDGSTRYFDLSNSSDDTDYEVTVDGTEVTSGITKYTGTVVFSTAPSSGASISATYYSTSQNAKTYTIGTRGQGVAGASSFTIGRGAVASSNDSFVIGRGCTAKAPNAISMGLDAVASGYYSKSIGWNTVAARQHQTAIGKNNAIDTYKEYSSDRLPVTDGKYAFIIGNGTSDNARSNALMVDWDGYIYPMAEKMADWVTEQGTSGIWTYRKWHSGIAECWGTYSASIAITSSSASYGGYRSAQITATAFPSGTFSAAPTVTATSMSAGGNWVTNTQGSTSTNAKFYLSCGTSSAASTRDIAIHAIGKWK